MNSTLATETVRLVRVFVSSPSDVAEERQVLAEVVDRINRTMGSRHLRMELAMWEHDVVPRIGPQPQEVVNAQTPPFSVLLGIMAYRFGTPTGQWGSGTEEEFRRACELWGELGSPWILFYFNRTPVDPETIDLEQFVKVKRFREELATRGLYASYVGVRGSPDAFFEKIELHLRQLLEQHLIPLQDRCSQAEAEADETIVPVDYARWLQVQCSEVELLGLRFKQGYAIRLSTVYVPLLTASAGQRARAPADAHEVGDLALGVGRPQRLLDALNDRSQYVAGPPGSGKSTFCRWATWLCLEDRMPAQAIESEAEHREAFPTQLAGRLPLLVPLREFWSLLSTLAPARECSASQMEQALHRWIEAKQPPGLTTKLLQRHLARGSMLLVFDGVDEVPLSRGADDSIWHPRDLLLSGLMAAIPAWTERGHRVLVASRPYGLSDDEVRRLQLVPSLIEPLTDGLQRLLVRRWYHLLEADHRAAEASAKSLLAHIREHDWLAPLRTSPMLLTAMCVVYNEGKRLPQDRHDLYTRVIDNVLHNRYTGDSTQLEAVRGRLSVIAHGMHTGAGLGETRSTPEAEATYAEVDRMLQVYRDQSAFSERGFVGAVEAREQLLSQTGLLIPLGNERAGFYHLSIQEFLAAQRIVDLDGDRLVEVFTDHAGRAEWRNTLSFAFSSLLARYVSPERSVRLLGSLIDRAGVAALGLAVVAAECAEILIGRGIRLQPDSEARFRAICLEAIEREVPVKERWLLGMALGRLGDPRIADDLRAASAWVQVPPGDYPTGEGHRVFRLRESLWIARWPTTNGQFAHFVDQDGYAALRPWWSEEGRAWLTAQGATEPFFWRSSRWNAPNQPVVGVSYWEAEAFAAWVGGRLPRESEWDAAARGVDGFAYPWGPDWEKGMCNSQEAGLNITSPVALFPSSRSRAFGLDDMGGNVWQWCLDTIGHGDVAGNQHVLRGCSWHDARWTSRAENRGRLSPGARLDHIGFRVVRNSAP